MCARCMVHSRPIATWAMCGRDAASALRLQARPGDVAVQGLVELAEISGSDTFVHAATPWGELVAQITGVHYLELGRDRKSVV